VEILRRFSKTTARVNKVMPIIGITAEYGRRQRQGSRAMDNIYSDIDEADPAFEKLLSDNRDRYIQQSSKTRCGQVAPLPERAGTGERSSQPKDHAKFLRNRPAWELSVAAQRA